MRVLIITPYFPPKSGGVEHYTYNISKGLVERGHKVTVITTDKEDYEESLHGIRVFRLKNRASISNTPLNLRIFREVSDKILDEKIHLVNAHMPVPFLADMAAIAAKRNDTPFVLTYHNDVVKDSGLLKLASRAYNNSLMKLTLKLSARIITPSPYVYKESTILRGYYDLIELIPPAVDPETYKPGNSNLREKYGIPEDSKIVLFVGAMNRGHRHKGVDVLLRAFSKIEDEDNYLVLAGSGDMIPEYRKLAESLSIADKAVFMGFVSENQLIDLYRTSDILVLPTLTIAEGFGMVLIEANACGTPVIGSKVGGIKYVIRDGETGILVPPGDPVALADAITRILEDEELAARMGSNGRRMVMENYTWDKSARMTERVFEEVIS
ncbi:glycosyltransferase family 4 protein [Methanothermobacter sp.]|uniref:glycosyltransferase family 4 protein n=1 Tax=Methanothermobacter sp. TaxID=1884223 RepID=UPI003C748BBB